MPLLLLCIGIISPLSAIASLWDALTIQAYCMECALLDGQ
jgi:hypothetical protein